MKKRSIIDSLTGEKGFVGRTKLLSLLFLLHLFLLGAVQPLFAQEKVKLTGTVTDEAGPLPGVSVVVKGTNIGTITDINGNYVLESQQKEGILLVKFVGMEDQEIAFNGSATYNFTMKSTMFDLEEVVVVGYGTQKARNVTGSVAVVTMEDIKDIPAASISEALAGQIPGVSVSGGSSRPGENASISVRQSFSLSKDGGNSVPLVIIDDIIQVDPETGLATLEQFNLLDPSEVESITVLRDGSAAIYGARASQGAIIVKTKRGSTGEPKISYSGQFSINDAVSHTKTMSAYEYGQFANSFLRSTDDNMDVKYLYSDSELEEMKSLNYNWLDKAWSSAFTQRHSINVNGGSDKATYFAGVSYYDQGANLGNQTYEKWSFRTGVDIKLKTNLSLSASVSANKGEQTKSFTKIVGSLNDSSYGSKAGGEQADYGYLVHMPKYIPWSYEIDGVEEWVSPALGPFKRVTNANSANQIGAWNYFGLLDSGSKQTEDDFSYTANFSLNYDVAFIKGLSLKGTYAVSQNNSDSEQNQLPYNIALSQNSNEQDKHLYTSNTTWNTVEINKNARVVYNDDISKYTQYNFYVNYNRDFGLHNVSAMGAVERSESSIHSKTLMYEGTQANIYNGTSATAGTLSTSNSATSRSESGTLSYLGRVNYNYDSKYLFQFLFRSDASTKFAPENYWGFFPSFQFGWVISEEKWFKDNVSWVDFLKIRASVGKTGKDNVKPWRWMQTYDYSTDKGIQFGSNGGTLGKSLSPAATPNREVTWDTTIKKNIGFDATFLDRRLKLTYDFYYDKNKDILISLANTVGTPISVGGGYAEENYAAINAWGSEISISWNDKIGEVGYSVGVNFGFSDNKYKKYQDLANAIPSSNTIRVGNSLNTPTWGFNVWKETSTGDGIIRTDEDITNYWAYLTERATAAGSTPSFMGITDVTKMKKGMLAYQDLYGSLNDDGTMSGPNGKIESGNDYTKLVKKDKSRGFTTSLGLKWKGLSWNALISTNWGTYKELDVIKQGTSSNQMLWAHESYWTDMYDADLNVDGKYPNLAQYTYISDNSDFWQVSGFRCYVKNMSIGYTLPKEWTSKIDINNAKISLTGSNLWDFYNPYPGKYRNMYDNSYENYPTLRTWSMNVNFSF